MNTKHVNKAKFTPYAGLDCEHLLTQDTKDKISQECEKLAAYYGDSTAYTIKQDFDSKDDQDYLFREIMKDYVICYVTNGYEESKDRLISEEILGEYLYYCTDKERALIDDSANVDFMNFCKEVFIDFGGNTLEVLKYLNSSAGIQSFCSRWDEMSWRDIIDSGQASCTADWIDYVGALDV